MADPAALQNALAGAHAAVYAYGLAGARLTGTDRARALTAMAEQRRVRDRLLDLLTGEGQSPTPAAAAYDPPFAVDSPAAARRLAGLVEDRMAGLLAAAAGATDGSARTWAAGAAQACAVRATTWTGTAAVWSGEA